MSNGHETSPAAPERLSSREVNRQYEQLDLHACSSYFDYFPLPLIVVNRQRQIVFSNRAFYATLGADNLDEYVGMRPGEAMGCAYADREPTGCGTSEHCRECGALKVVTDCIADKAETQQECQLLLSEEVDGSNARDLRVHAVPWETAEGLYYVVTIQDIAHEKRRRVLERLFFHDILNSVNGARSLAEVLKLESDGSTRELADIIHSSLFGLTEEIVSHKELLAIENREYTNAPITLQGLEVLEAVVSQFRHHIKAADRRITLAEDSESLTVRADHALLRRVLANMVINALEATPEGGTVTAGLQRDGDRAVFRVHNPTVMDRATRLQVFKRSFSTKGPGRGLGTYSIKLLTERYMDGTAEFSSREGEGTTFRVILPTVPEGA